MGWLSSIKELFSSNKNSSNEDFVLFKENIKRSLYEADLGPKICEEIIDEVQASDDFESIKTKIEQKLFKILKPFEGSIQIDKEPYVVILLGVNGSGKTTTTAKLANYFKNECSKKVLLCGADTFRAAAVEQLKHWADKIGCEFFSKGSGADPAATAYEAVQKAVKEKFELLIIDTGGRLHTQQGLMAELAKVHKAVGKSLNGAPHQNLLVIDSTQGQNIHNQVEIFNNFIELTGIILTKFDGTAKGGAIVRTLQDFKKPLMFITSGEGVQDLGKFDTSKFIGKIW
jgi:fused signal recognition particle receptor